METSKIWFVRAQFLAASGSKAGPVSKARTGWAIEGVSGLPANPFGWYAYELERKLWFVVEGRSGYSVSSGETRSEAIFRFLNNAGNLATWEHLATKLDPVGLLPSGDGDA